MNKRIVILGLLVAIMSASAFAIAPVGPPTAGLKTGQWSVGFDYAHGEIDVFDIDWSTGLGIDLAALGLKKAKGKDVKSDAYLAKFGYGISDDWEFYGFLGGADSRGKIEWSDGSSDNFDGGYDFSGGFGTKWTFLKEENLSWGLVYQMSWTQGDDSWTFDTSGFGAPYPASVTIDADTESFDIFLALGPTYEMGNWRVYGGAALYYYDADIEVSYLDTTILEGDVDEAMFGGYVGAAFDLNESTSLYAEYMLAGDAWMLGTGIVWKF
jgi:hypothetical protein